MQHKCKSHTRGSGAGAVAYLMGLKDHKGRIRAGVEVLRGNPEVTAMLIDSLKTEHRYTSGVIAWAPEDAPTDAEIQAVMDDWERVAFAGLRKSQYTFCAVLHTEDDGSKHVHMIVPRVNLEDGRALNIAPPGHEYYFAKWRNVWNHDKGWARPDDQSRARLVQPGVKAFRTVEELKSGLAQAPDPKLMLHEHLTERVASGQVQTRHDVLEVLSELAEINRVGKDYVSVKLEDGTKLRLKGLLYGDNFSPGFIAETGAAQAARPAGRAAPDPAAAAAARDLLAAAVASRASYNEERYSKPVRVAGRGAEAREAAIAAAREATQRAASVDQFRDRYFGRSDQQTPDLAIDVAGIGELPGVDPGDLRSTALELVDSQPSQQPIGENIIRPTDEVGADEHRVLQQSSRQEILQTSTINMYLTSGYILNIINGENNGGLHKPGARWPGYQRSGQYAAGLSSLQTLSSLNLDVVWKGADSLLPAAARGDLERGAESLPGSLRRTDSRVGLDAQEAADAAATTGAGGGVAAAGAVVVEPPPPPQAVNRTAIAETETALLKTVLFMNLTRNVDIYKSTLHETFG